MGSQPESAVQVCILALMRLVAVTMAERIYNRYVNAAVWSLVYMKTQTVSVQDPLWDKSSVFPREQPSSELLCFCTPSLFSPPPPPPLTLVISSKAEDAHEWRKLGEKALFCE